MKMYKLATFRSLNSKDTDLIETVNAVLMTHLALEPPCFSGHLTLDSDTCSVQVGCVHLQKQPDDRTKLIDFWFQSLIDTGRRYDITKRRCFAIVLSVLLLRLYLGGNRINIETSYNALLWIPNITGSTRSNARWQLDLFKLGFDVANCAGTKHRAADPLSQLNTPGKEESFPKDDFLLYAVDKFDKQLVSVQVVARKVYRAQRVPNTKPSDDESE